MSSALGPLASGLGVAGPQILAGYGAGLAGSEQALALQDRRQKELAFRRLQLMQQALEMSQRGQIAAADRASREKIAKGDREGAEIRDLERGFADQDTVAGWHATGQLVPRVKRYQELTGRMPFDLGTPAPPPGPAVPGADQPPVLPSQLEGPSFDYSPKYKADVARTEADTEGSKAKTRSDELKNFVFAATINPQIQKAIAEGKTAEAEAEWARMRPLFEQGKLYLEGLKAQNQAAYQQGQLRLGGQRIESNERIQFAGQASREREGAANRQVEREKIQAANARARAILAAQGPERQARIDKLKAEVAKLKKTGSDQWTQAEKTAVDLWMKQLTATTTERTLTGSTTRFTYGDQGGTRERALGNLINFLEGKGVDLGQGAARGSGLGARGGPGAGSGEPRAADQRRTPKTSFAPEELAYARRLLARGEAAIAAQIEATRADRGEQAALDLTDAIQHLKRSRPKGTVKIQERR